MPPPHESEPFRRFLQRVWQADVQPLLRDHRAAQRHQSARVGGRVAAAGGLFVDALLGLRGRPFTRALTVLGARVGALLPDVWDWQIFRSATPEQRATIAARVEDRAGTLEDREALELLGLTEEATPEDLRSAWHAASRRWHPDKAPDESQRQEYHVRFLIYKGAYERLRTAHAEGRLPRSRSA